MFAHSNTLFALVVFVTDKTARGLYSSIFSTAVILVSNSDNFKCIVASDFSMLSILGITALSDLISVMISVAHGGVTFPDVAAMGVDALKITGDC